MSHTFRTPGPAETDSAYAANPPPIPPPIPPQNTVVAPSEGPQRASPPRRPASTADQALRREADTQPSEPRPAALPLGYVAGWAVIALASTAYLGLTLSNTAAPKHGDRLASANETLTEARGGGVSRSGELSEQLARKRESLAEVVAELSRPPGGLDQASRPSKAAGSQDEVIATRKVPTVRLEPARPPAGIAVLNAPAPVPTAPVVNQPSVPQAQPAAVAAAPPTGTAAITTGSIGRLPPPPLRAPAPPAAFLKARADAKAAAEAKARLAALERQKADEAAQRAKPVVFGPATVNRSNASGSQGEAVSPAAVQPASRPPVLGAAIGVRLATAPSVDALRLQWTLLSERFGTQLTGLSPRYVQASANGIGASYELIAGPVPGTIEALEICQGIVRNGGARCIIGDFVGNAL